MNPDSLPRGMSAGAARVIVVGAAVIAAVIFAGVALTEINYVSGHPYAYGPAKVIAWGAGAGALLSLAVAMLGAKVRLRG